MIKFNTGRKYSPEGQRIAAETFDGGIVMVDIDRGIDYFLPSAELSQSSIMYAYDRNYTCGPTDYAAYSAMVRKLEKEAL